MLKIYIIILSFLFMSCDIHTNYQDEKLKEYFHDQWEQGLEDYPEFATYLGDHRYNDRLTDMSIAAIHKRNSQTQESTLAGSGFSPVGNREQETFSISELHSASLAG